MFTETNPTPNQGQRTVRTSTNHNRLSRCPGPQGHPHIYIDIAEAYRILCPYCGTRFRFDRRSTPLDADPPDSFSVDHNAA